jgi:hypothetical protein
MKQQRLHLEKRGSLTGQGNTKTQAKADLERQIEWAIAWNPSQIEVRHGRLIVVLATSDGYGYRIVEKDDLDKPDRVLMLTTFFGQTDFSSVMQQARAALAQMAWTHEADDEQHIEASGLDDQHADQVRSWMAWQRRYQASIVLGLSPDDAWKSASGLSGTPA